MKLVFRKEYDKRFNLQKLLKQKKATDIIYYGDFILDNKNYENYHARINGQIYLFTACIIRPYTLLVVQPEGYPEVADSWIAYHYLKTGEIRQPTVRESVDFHFHAKPLMKDVPVYLPDR